MTSGFDLDLQAVEDEIERDDDHEGDRRIVLGVLDGTTDEREWFEVIDDGNVLVLSIEGELADLAGDLTALVQDAGGRLVHFRGFLVVTPPDVSVDSDRL